MIEFKSHNGGVEMKAIGDIDTLIADFIIVAHSLYVNIDQNDKEQARMFKEKFSSSIHLALLDEARFNETKFNPKDSVLRDPKKLEKLSRIEGDVMAYINNKYRQLKREDSDDMADEFRRFMLMNANEPFRDMDEILEDLKAMGHDIVEDVLSQIISGGKKGGSTFES